MKVIAVFLCLLCFVSIIGIPTFAAEDSLFKEEVVTESQFTPGVDSIELISNNSFETLASETTFDKWGLVCTGKDADGNGQKYIGSSYINLSSDANSGNRALRLTCIKNEHVHALMGVSFTPGVTYELSGYAKHSGNPGSAFLSIIINGKENGATAQLGRVNLSFSDIPSGQWTKKILRFTVPENAKSGSLMTRLMGEGEVIWDDISLLMEADEIPEPEIIEKKPSLEDLEIDNYSFEDYTPGIRPGWYCYSGKNGEPNGTSISFSSDYAYSGNKSARISVENGAVAPWVSQGISGFVPGATYQLSAYILIPGINRMDVCVTVEWYTSPEPVSSADQGGVAKDHWTLTQSDEWRNIILEFDVPDNAISAIIRYRTFSTVGFFHVDNVSLYMVEMPDYAYVESDETFYYTEWPEGTVSALANSYHNDALDNGYAEFAFVDKDGTEKYAEKVPFINNEAKYTFKTAWMEEKGTEYSVITRIFNADKSKVQETVTLIYRYDRPTYLGADGVFRKNNKEYNIVLGNGVNQERLALGPEKGGVTVVQLVADSDIPMLQKMDAAHARGLLVLINFYNGDICAGSKEQVESTKATVRLVKDHPALFGYKVQDEPIQKNNTDEELARAYKIIHDIDPHHPVYLDDSVYSDYDRLYRYADIIDIDYYGGGNADSGRIFSTVLEYAKNATRGRKPFTLLQQAFEYNNYLPTFNELRHFAYQALFAGAAGAGYHSLGSDDGVQGIFMARPVWDEICEKWAPWEQGFLLDAFVNHKYPQINAYKDYNTMWRTYAVGVEIYAVVFNRNKTAVHTANIPLIDGEGKTVCEAFSATRVAGGNTKTIVDEGTLSLELGALSAEIWKITPAQPQNLSYLKTTSYQDLFEYPWANNAIACLEEEGVTNKFSDTWYGPGEKISRGDFAMFLVRALDLTADTSDNFSDVNPEAEYADEVAIGKKLGILQDIGDGNFNPEGEITRREMMDITARGIRLKKGSAGNLDGFTDASAGADWAVLDVAEMVRFGMVRGNADEMVNPVENTTRAEAAVVINQALLQIRQPSMSDSLLTSAGELSAEEREALYEGFTVSDGTYEGDVWKNTYTSGDKTYALFVNYGSEAVSFSENFSSPTVITKLLSPGDTASYASGKFELILSPGRIGFFELNSAPENALFRTDLVLHRLSDGAMWKGGTAVLYKEYDGVPEVLEFIENGDTVNVGTGAYALKTFFWTSHFEPEAPVLVYKTP